MKKKTLDRLIPPLLTALIIAAGFLIPQKMLSWRETQIKAEEGIADIKNISFLDYGIASSREKILQLSALAVELFDRNDGDGIESELIYQREPLDTELSYEAAIESALVFLETFLSNMESYGLPLNDGALYFYSGDSMESAAVQRSPSTGSSTDIIEVVFYASAEDASLSFWVVEQSGSLIVLDGISGMPVYFEISADLDWELTDEENFCECVSLSVCDIYNVMYSFSFLSSFSSMSSDSVLPSWTYGYISNNGYNLLSTTMVENVFEAGCTYHTRFWLSE